MANTIKIIFIPLTMINLYMNNMLVEYVEITSVLLNDEMRLLFLRQLFTPWVYFMNLINLHPRLVYSIS